LTQLTGWRAWKPVSVVVSPGVEPGVVNKADVIAIKAVAAGEATPEQQVRALNAVILQVACVNEMSFCPEHKGGSRETDFAEGKRFVGLQLQKLIRTPLRILTGEKSSES
jgi:hypothetical protein